MNWAKGIKYLGYLFLGVGIFILGTWVKDDPEKWAEIIIEVVVFPDPEFTSDFPEAKQIRTVFLTLFSLIGIGVVLLVFGLGADREKE